MSSHVDKGIIEELINNGTISDLVVVTLLRINSGFTKEALSKALFNFLSRSEFRQVMVGKGERGDLDLFGAILELARVELLELLDLSVRLIYNLSCELTVPSYAKKMQVLKIPQLLIARITHNIAVPGVRATNPIKMQCGKKRDFMNNNVALRVFFCIVHVFRDIFP